MIKIDEYEIRSFIKLENDTSFVNSAIHQRISLTTREMIAAADSPKRIERIISIEADFRASFPFDCLIPVAQCNVTVGWHKTFSKNDACWIK